MDVEKSEVIEMLPFYRAVENNKKNVVYYLLDRYKKKGQNNKDDNNKEFDTSLFYFTDS